MIDWIFGFFMWIYSYFSAWALLLFFGTLYGIVPPEYSIATKASLLLSSIGGAYVTYVYPRQITISCFPVIIHFKGIPMMISDIVAHHIPTLYAFYYLPDIGNVAPLIVLFTIYFMTTSPDINYGLRLIDMFSIGVMFFLAWQLYHNCYRTLN